MLTHAISPLPDAVEEVINKVIGQLVSYLRAMRLNAGLLINFHTDHLKGSIRRVVV